MHTPLALTLWSLVAAWPVAAHAADALEQARSAEGSLNYKAVIQHATAALSEPRNSHEALIEIYRLIGSANAVLGKHEAAIDAFKLLLAIEPEFKLRAGESPKIRRPFKEAGGYWMGRPGGLKVTADLPSRVSGGRSVSINVHLDDPLKMTRKVALAYRRTGEAAFVTVEEATAATLTLTIPANAVAQDSSAYDLEVKVIALDAHGGELRLVGDRVHIINVPARVDLLVGAGTDGAPFVAQAPKKKSTIHKKWWFWTAIVLGAGAVATAAGLGAWYATKPNSTDFAVRTEVLPVQ